MPRTPTGKWSLELLGLFAVLLAFFYLMVAMGQRGGMAFFDNLLLSIPILLAGGAGIAAFFTGVIGIIKDRERSITVFLSTAIGFLILVFGLGEIIFPH